MVKALDLLYDRQELFPATKTKPVTEARKRGEHAKD